MAKLSDLIPEMSRHLEIPEETVSVFARHLRLARLISTSGRGRGGADMTPTDCTNLLLAMLSGMPAKDSAQAVSIYTKLKSPLPWMRDEDAPVVPWLEELKNATLGRALDRLLTAATTDKFANLEREAIDATTARNWYVIVRIMSPKPDGKILIGAGIPEFAGEFRKYNKVIASIDFKQGVITQDPSDKRNFEEFVAAQRGWNSDRIRMEQISHGTLRRLGKLLKR
jgi:hypothetical protein